MMTTILKGDVMRGVQVLVGAVIALSVVGQNATAETFDWTLTGPSLQNQGFNTDPLNGSGTITATESGGVWTITGATGSFTDVYGGGATVTGVGPEASNAISVTPDNEINPSGSPSFVDGQGISFATSTGPIDIAFISGAYEEVSHLGIGDGAFTLAATPLPAALPLFASGLGALGFLGWRRKRTARSLAV
jgi:hypothetical protein